MSLLNLDTVINGLVLGSGSSTNFTCTINDGSCTKVIGIANEGGAKITFSGTANA